MAFLIRQMTPSPFGTTDSARKEEGSHVTQQLLPELDDIVPRPFISSHQIHSLRSNRQNVPHCASHGRVRLLQLLHLLPLSLALRVRVRSNFASPILGRVCDHAIAIDTLATYPWVYHMNNSS